MCNLDKTLSLQEYLFVGSMASAGLTIFLIVMEWKNWGM